jgi:hypothetical protein
MRKSLFAGLLVALAACGPVRHVDVSYGPSPWYTYCSWDAACWYGPNQVFVYGWGYVDRPTYVMLRGDPGRRERWANRRRDWYPQQRPQYRGQDWDGHKGGRDRGRGKDRDRKSRDRDR